MENIIRILSLEDDEIDFDLIRRSLESSGIEHEILRVETEKAYKRALDEFNPDLILADYRLPSYDGTSALAIARKKLPHVPFIFVSGSIGEEKAIESLKMGATDYVLKERLSRLEPSVLRALKEADERMRRSEIEAALVESEERHRTIFEASGTAMCVIEEGGRIVLANSQFCEMIGRGTDNDISGISIADILEDKSIFIFNELLKKVEGKDQKHPVYGELIVDSKGGFLSCLVSMASMSERQYFIVSLIDISNERLYEAELKSKADELRDFLNIASHELRHPVSLLMGYAELFLAKSIDVESDSGKTALKSIKESARRLTTIVEELLDVSRIETGRMKVEKDRMNPKDVIRIVIREMGLRYEHREFLFRCEDEDLEIVSDAGKLRRVLAILIDNAVKFSSSECTVEIDLELNEELLRVSVSDRGAGIPEEKRERIFERFVRMDDPLHHSVPGLGLGLFIAKRIMNSFKGKIWYEARDGGGSVFFIEIPL